MEIALTVIGCALGAAFVGLLWLRGRLVRRELEAAASVELRVPLWLVLFFALIAVLLTLLLAVGILAHLVLAAMGVHRDVPLSVGAAPLMVLLTVVFAVIQFAWRVRVDAIGVSGRSLWLQRRFALRWSDIRALRRRLGGSWVIESAKGRVVIPGSADGFARFAELALEHLPPEIRAPVEARLRRAAGVTPRRSALADTGQVSARPKET